MLLELLEIGGRTKHLNTIDAFTSKFDILILVFDINDISSFKEIGKYLSKVSPDSKAPVLLIGTKADLIQNGYFSSSYKDDQLYQFVLQKGYLVLEISMYAFDYTPIEYCINQVLSTARKSNHDILNFD